MAVIVDPLREWDDLGGPGRSIITPAHRNYPESAADADKILRTLVLKTPQVRKVDLWLLDEANRYCPHGKPMPRTIDWLNDTIRHLEPDPSVAGLSKKNGMAWLLIARRPVQLAVHLVELAHIVIFFRLTGRNDLRYADDLHDGLGDRIRTLGHHEFIVRDAHGNIEQYPKLDITTTP